MLKLMPRAAFCAALLLSSLPALGFDARMIREGDKLKITFFETMDLPDASGAERGGGDGAKIRVFYQRLDLSGDYTVDAAGAVSIPVLGSVGAAGKTTGDLRDSVLGALEKTTGRSGGASVAIVERQPVFVAGAVSRPGAYPFSPGMIAIQAIALAGGPERGALDQSFGLIDRTDRAELARDRLIKALARRAILVAGRDDRPVVPPRRLIELSGAAGAKEIVGAERRSVMLRLEAKRGDLAMKREAATATRAEIAAMQDRLADAERQIAARADRLRKAEDIYGNRFFVDDRIVAARRDLFDLQGRRSEDKLALIRAQNRLAQTELEMKNAGAAIRVELDGEIRQLDQWIAEAEQHIRSGEKTDVLAGRRLGGAARGASMQIIRVDRSGTKIFDADNTTELAPGDVLSFGGERAAPPPARDNAAALPN